MMIEDLAIECTRLSSAILGEPAPKVVLIERGVMNFKFLVAPPGGRRYVLRFYPPSRRAVVDYEPELIRRCAARGLLVPKVLTDSRQSPPAMLAYCIYEYIDGTVLADRASTLTQKELRSLAVSLAGSLQKVASVPVTGFGELITAERARFASWPEFLETVFSEGIANAEQHQLWPADSLGALKSIQAHLGQVPPPAVAGLALGDLSPENILIDDENNLAGLLDLEGAVAGELLLNLGYCYARDPNAPLFQALLDSWPTLLAAADWDRIYIYAVIRALGIARFAHRPLPSGYPRMPISRLLPGAGLAMQSVARRLSRRSAEDIP